MNSNQQSLLTPIFLKQQADLAWPEDENVFYLLTASGLFLCRDHPLFQSCVPAPAWPSELKPQRPFLQLRYPKVPRKMFEAIVGFFDRIGQRHGSEAGVLLAWDRPVGRIRLIVPKQTATVSRSWYGSIYPIGLHYEMPETLPAGWTIIGDIHSHVNEPAYASATDRSDETYRAGLHIVVGRLDRDPPELHVEAVVDGTRFTVDPTEVLEGYAERRLRVPQRWLERVEVEPYPKQSPAYSSNRGYYSDSSYHGTSYVVAPKPQRIDHAAQLDEKDNGSDKRRRPTEGGNR